MKKVYFASDFHLGAPNYAESRERELCIVRWLDSIKEDAEAIYLLGDLFDFWFEYAQAVPKGYIRFFGKLAELRDTGIPIYAFVGNHDMWMGDYLEKELDIPTIYDPILKTIGGKRFFLGHGDGLGPGDYGYKRLKKIFRNPVCKWLFARIHPNLGIKIAQFWAGKSRGKTFRLEEFLGKEKEWLYLYCNKKIETEDIDFFIFGHRHLPLDITLKNEKSRYINLGEWMNFRTYAVFDGAELQLKYFESDNHETVSL